MKHNILSKSKRLHFVGIGGIGMSGIARVAIEMGHTVSGSDLELNDLTKKLESIGARIFEGHKAENLKDTDLLIYSSSVDEKNPELLEARKNRVKLVHRAELLGAIFNGKKGIAVTGTHGKTTTTSLVSVMLEKCGLSPTVIIGGEVDCFNGNSKLGKGPYAVAEADESDSSFLCLKPSIAVITNIELEHMDHFKDLDHVKRSYRSFVNNTKTGGTVIYNNDDPNCADVMADFKGLSFNFGFSDNSDIYPTEVRMNRFSTTFKCVYRNKVLGEVRLSIPGRHNVLNALAALLAGMRMGLEFKDIRKSIKDFGGAKRRFQLRADAGGIMLIDDYAHHPTEIRAVLRACREGWKDRRLIAVFQPHRYSRTKYFADNFGNSFKDADLLILTDIYAASEQPVEDVSVKNIYEKARESGVSNVIILEKDEIASHILAMAKRGDMIVVMGAGNIKKVADEICHGLTNRPVADRIVNGLKTKVRGKIARGERLSKHTSFRIGGASDIWFEPKDYRDLSLALSFADKNKIPVFIIGNGSNILAKDEGFAGMTVRLGEKFFRRISKNGRSVRVGAGFGLPGLIRFCCGEGLRGLESLVGIPGTVGGAIRINAGGWNSPVYKNIGDVVTSLKVMDYKGRMNTLKKNEISFGYRRSNLDGYIILEANLKLDKAPKEDLISSCSRFLRMKKEKQVLDVPSAGCVFKNPQDFQFTCGQMIDMLGLKGKRVGNAEVSARHANFIVNRGNAACRDVLSLIGLIRKNVKENYGIDLELEIDIV